MKRSQSFTWAENLFATFVYEFQILPLTPPWRLLHKQIYTLYDRLLRDIALGRLRTSRMDFTDILSHAYSFTA